MEKDWIELIRNLSLEESKRLLLSLAKEIFSVLRPEEKRQFVMDMVGQTGNDRIGSMVQL